MKRLHPKPSPPNRVSRNNSNNDSPGKSSEKKPTYFIRVKNYIKNLIKNSGDKVLNNLLVAGLTLLLTINYNKFIADPLLDIEVKISIVDYDNNFPLESIPVSVANYDDVFLTNENGEVVVELEVKSTAEKLKLSVGGANDYELKSKIIEIPLDSPRSMKTGFKLKSKYRGELN